MLGIGLYNAFLSLLLSLGFTSIGVHFKEQQDSLPALLNENYTDCPEGWVIVNKEKWKCIKVIVRPLVTASWGKKLCDIAAEAAITKNQNKNIFDGNTTAAEKRLKIYHSMLTIQSLEEQKAVNNILFSPYNYNITSGVWLGGFRSRKGFKWMDGSAPNFTNWAKTSSSLLLDWNADDGTRNGNGNACVRKCIRMIPPVRISLDIRFQGHGSSGTDDQLGGGGKWQIVDCERRSAVVCQFSTKKAPTDIQSLFLEFQKNVTKQLDKDEKQLNETHKLVEDLKKRIEQVKLNQTEVQNVETHIFQ